MTESQTGYAEINGTRLYYEVAGAGHPLVLIHAGICDSRMWDEQMPVFAQHYRVIRYDVRGFGHSPAPAGPFANYKDLHGLLQFLGVERAHLVGVSMAGTIASEFALAYPEMVNALVLVASVVRGKQPSEFMVQRETVIDEAIDAGDIARAVELELRLWVDGRGRAPEQVDPAVRERVRVMNSANFASNNDAAEPQPLTPPVIERLGQIRAPMLVLYGDLDVPDVLESADILAGGIVGARRVVMPGTAHLPSMEQPDEFNELVLEFLGVLEPEG